jgi:copper chaperone CopZ
MKTNRYLNLKGATCASCAYTIEKTGRKLDGVEEVYVDVVDKKVNVTFSESQVEKQDEVLKTIQKVIQKLGYDADIIEQ